MPPRRKRASGIFRPTEVNVDSTDPFPVKLLESLRELPSDDHCNEPSLKRLRIDTDAPDPTDAVCVGKGQITIHRAQRPTSADEEFSRPDVGRHIRVSVGTNLQTDEEYINIRSLSDTSSAALNTVLCLAPGSVSAGAATILDAAGGSETKTKTTQQTGLSTVINVETRRRGEFLDIDISLELWWATRLYYHHGGLSRSSIQILHKVIEVFLPPEIPVSDKEEWSPLDFYESAFVPDKDDADANSIVVPGMTASLYPFQKRTLKWLLMREGVAGPKSSNGSGDHGQPPLSRGTNGLPLSFREIRDLNGKIFYLSEVFLVVATDLTHFRIAENSLSGGILAEEMGLGKTLEMISLILLHRRSADEPEVDFQGITNTGATLIVTPESLRRQWIDELARHAPNLRVMPYSGCKIDSLEEELALIDELARQDVIVTTYSIVSAEVHYVLEPPQRPRRYERRYHRTKSPLMQLGWWRVCLDEAQMIESGVSHAAEVAKLVPRVNAWGITGTPVKNSVQDLRGLLIFLRYQPYNFSTHSWRDLTTKYKSAFRQLFNKLALRHTKALVRNEIKLPRQDRFVITLPFAAVEEQHYQSMFQDMAEDCGLDVQGVPVVPNWEFESHSENMGVWLNRLRQAALHPEVAMRRLMSHTKNRPMQTVDEVLDAMIEQNERTILTEQRSYLMARLTRGQLLENGPRIKEALALWGKVRDEVMPVVAHCEKKLQRAMRETSNGSALSGDTERSDEETGALSYENQTKLTDLRGRLRSALEILHRAVFFCGNAYFQIRENAELTEPESDEFKRLQELENKCYEEAKRIRRKILVESFRKSEALRARLQDSASSQSFVTIPELVARPERGLESRHLLDQLEELYGLLNEQANQLDTWREEVIQMLVQPLVDDEDGAELTGEEFSESTQIQEKLMVYVLMLKAAIADRQDIISGQVNELVKHEMAMATINAESGLSPAPELFLRLSSLRDQLRQGPRDVPMRSVIGNLRQLRHRYLNDDSNERYALEGRIADVQIQSIQAQSTEQHKVASGLKSELERFTASMNSRLEYYRQLQAVSDSVLPYEGPRSEELIQSMLASEEKNGLKLSAAEAKHRYLMNLKETGSRSSEPRMCVICQTTFTTGVLTVCGHQFCQGCMRLWFRAHRNCPVCKTHLNASNLHDIVLNPQQLRIRSDVANGVSNAEVGHEPRRGAHPRSSIYSEFSAEKLEAIKNIELHGPSFTTKVDALVRHLLWLRKADPGSKSIIFSSFPYFLGILENAFKRYGIGYTSITRPNGISDFQEDSSLEVFILYAKAHSSGLNLVNATHVFLCEPLLNTALELQAIARIDRIGQQHETTVWLYLVDGTVEESIYNLSASRRLEHMGRATRGKGGRGAASAEELEVANTLELEQAQLSRLIRKDGNGGEVVDKGDVWQCLFGQSPEAPAREGSAGG